MPKSNRRPSCFLISREDRAVNTTSFSVNHRQNTCSYRTTAAKRHIFYIPVSSGPASTYYDRIAVGFASTALVLLSQRDDRVVTFLPWEMVRNMARDQAGKKDWRNSLHHPREGTHGI